MAAKTHIKRETRHVRYPRRPRRSRYIPALDGLRAIAVLAVIFYHMDVEFAPGGLMGVTVFFVISGYLICGLLVAEHERTGRISLSQFWLRRVRRIVPAVLLAIAGTVALCALISPSLLDKARPDIVPSLLFYNNWWQIFHDVSYFEAASAPSPLTHFWSLAIEEQFYIVWPLLLIAMFKGKFSKRAIGGVVIALAALSAGEMALLYNPMGDPSRVYYGTDTRAVSLLIGVWLAIAWPSAAFGHRRSADADRATWIVFNAAGLVALIGILVIMAITTGYSSFPYYGGIVLVSALSAVLIAVLVVPDTWVSRLLDFSALVWIGKRSYSMYLWHFPIILLTSKIGLPIIVPWWVRAAQLVVIFALSELSYRFVEDPIRRGNLGRWWRERTSGQVPSVKTRMRRAATVTVVAGVTAAAVVGVVMVPAPKTQPHATATQTMLLAGANAGGVSSAQAASSADGTSAQAAGALAPVYEAAERAKEKAFSDEGARGRRAGWFNGLVESTRAAAAAHPRSEQTMLHDAIGSARTLILDSSPIKRTITSAREIAAERRDEIVGSALDDALYTEHLNKAGETMYSPLLIGDSVSAGCVDEFCEAFPYGCIDAVPNRNVWESPYSTYADADQVGNYVVFCLGTNNVVNDGLLDEMLSVVGKNKKVILVNIRAPRDWEATTNETLAKAPERYSNVIKVVDWYSASAGHDEYFIEDGIHLRDSGPAAYIGLIYDAIEEDIAATALAKATAK